MFYCFSLYEPFHRGFSIIMLCLGQTLSLAHVSLLNSGRFILSPKSTCVITQHNACHICLNNLKTVSQLFPLFATQEGTKKRGHISTVKDVWSEMMIALETNTRFPILEFTHSYSYITHSTTCLTLTCVCYVCCGLCSLEMWALSWDEEQDTELW